MPKPNPNESRDEFISRCLPIVIDDGMAESQDQAIAVCNSMWEDDKHATFVKALAKRTKRDAEFGYGIGTAEYYMRSWMDCGVKLPGEAKFGREQLLKEAAQKTVYCNPDMVVEGYKDLGSTDVGTDGFELSYVVTTPREDRDGDILLTEGARQDPKAPLLWQHEPFLPLGPVKGIVEQTKDILRATAGILNYESQSELANLAKDAVVLVKAGVLRISHGFKAIDWEEREKDGGSDGWPGFLIREYEIMEHSLVSVPSNVDAEIELWSRGELRCDMVKAHAKDHWDQRQVMVSVPEPKEWSTTDTVVSSNGDDGLPAANEEPDTKQAEPDDEKTGRVLSNSNVKLVKSVIDDLGEIKDMSTTKAGEALCERCISRLEELLSKSSIEEESTKPETKQITAHEAMRIVLTDASVEQQETLVASIRAINRVRSEGMKARPLVAALGL